MHSKNKPKMTAAEREFVDQVKSMNCAVCGAPGPSEAHEIEQGMWFISVPLCPDCHRGSKNGLHGQRAMWKVMKATELSVLNATIANLVKGVL